MSDAPLLEVEGLAVTFPGAAEDVRVVDDVAFSVRTDRALGIVGESGAGKSVLLRTLTGLFRPAAGTIRFDSRDVTNARGASLKAYRRDVQMVFQNPYTSLPPGRAVQNILEEPLLIHGISRGEWQGRLDSALDGVGLSRSFLGRMPEQLSGGQRQRVAIARALVLEPRLILLDEPVSALDVSIRAQVLNLLTDLRRDRGLGFVVVSHDFSVLRFLAEDIAVMHRGQFVEQGETGAVFDHPRHEYTRRLLAAMPSIERSLARRGDIGEAGAAEEKQDV
ncbi:MAG: ATP-binding cassette domain-containing protein [Rhizobiaceae bacterium]|nr:ATP-binding cassette domain-containing protein [Rhizobiaceae bacterium]